MNNKQIARVFEDIADLLELKGENPFKIRAYQKVMRSIGELAVEVEQLVREDRLKEVPGVGEAITKKLTEMITTGKLDYYEKLKAEFPEGIIALLDIPGIGPKTAKKLVFDLKDKVAAELQGALGGSPVLIMDLVPAIVTHAGPGTLAVGYFVA